MVVATQRVPGAGRGQQAARAWGDERGEPRGELGIRDARAAIGSCSCVSSFDGVDGTLGGN